ncbi:hypothetical protein EVAR_44112_1 [Eumeta japonica]|uniref:Uncharacterized protein n=1 Tax=Eumeta variegata TaxID=151549 RepID=A0A4C2A0T2_EUMVA|nr:hypothetical protein EVAR_44112_1 [Eumeta japonica]
MGFSPLSLSHGEKYNKGLACQFECRGRREKNPKRYFCDVMRSYKNSYLCLSASCVRAPPTPARSGPASLSQLVRTSALFQYTAQIFLHVHGMKIIKAILPWTSVDVDDHDTVICRIIKATNGIYKNVSRHESCNDVWYNDTSTHLMIP